MLLVCGQLCNSELGMKLQIGRFRRLRVGSTESKLARRKSEERKQSSSLFLFRNRQKYDFELCYSSCTYVSKLYQLFPVQHTQKGNWISQCALQSAVMWLICLQISLCPIWQKDLSRNSLALPLAQEHTQR